MRITLELHDTPPGEGRAPMVEIDLGRLSPMARALAESVHATPLHARSGIWLESAATRRELFAENARRGRPAHMSDSAMWYTEEELDRPHGIPWCSWARYPVSSTVDPHDYLEGEARKLPLGYYPAGADFRDRVPSADAAQAATDLIPKARVLEILRDLGRPISAATMDNYRSRPPNGWPQPAQYVGRTPLWSETAIRSYATTLTREISRR